ncbi:MAG: DUF2007 domain-containing protein [Nitrospirae bacterium]|nr:MAG: DUF2007 domain-containing protein [Nitrospirota bacterium]
MTDVEWVELEVVFDPLEAEMIKDLLESGGIKTIVSSSRVTPYPVNVGKIGEVKIFVKKSDLEEAKRVIERKGQG